jgi:hypothetical protein
LKEKIFIFFIVIRAARDDRPVVCPVVCPVATVIAWFERRGIGRFIVNIEAVVSRSRTDAMEMILGPTSPYLTGNG